MRISKLVLISLLTFTFVNCSKNEENYTNTTNSFTQNFGNIVNRDFIGQIVDENSQPIGGVEIKIGSITKYTDFKGIFTIKNAEVYEKFAYITARKYGYINGSRTVVPNSGSNTIKIIMLSATVQATIHSGITSNVILSNGAKVTFDGNFKTDSGANYSGNINVMMHHLDPSDTDIADKMPGSLMAENSSGKQRVLETYGMLNIELQDDSCNKLQIVNPSTIEMPISSSQAVSAPNTIPLWYFNEVSGYWKEEGSATKVGNKYVGMVNHFSWWNCDGQFTAITLGIKVVNSNQAPIAGVRVELVRTGNPYGSDGYTNDVGQISGMVPANELLTMKIYNDNSFCSNQPIYTQQIGPFSSNTILPFVVLPTANTTIVQGTLTNCNQANVTNGYIILQTAGQSIYTQVTNGSFIFNLLNCTSATTSFVLQGFDLDTTKSTTQQTGALNNQTVSLGILQACTTSEEFVDIDQNVYTNYPIGQQTWMQQNLKVSRYTDGTVIPQVTDPTAWSNLTTGAWCYYNNDPANGAIYGKLYNWYAVAGIYDAASLANPSLRKKLAPTGWHIPTDTEWANLIIYLGGENIAGGKMKEVGILYWLSPNLGATNSSGFSGLPGGFHDSDGGFGQIGERGHWWSSSVYFQNFAYKRSVEYDFSFVEKGSFNEAFGISVRCIKD